MSTEETEVVHGEVLDNADPRGLKRAELRWVEDIDEREAATDEDGDTYWTTIFVTADGEDIGLSAWNPEVFDFLTQLPRDYLELGTEAANRVEDLRMELREAKNAETAAREEADKANGRLDHLGDNEKQKRLLVILQEDLEKSINMLTRYAQALGIQEGGILYDQVQELRSKYKMGPYIAPDHALETLIEPLGDGTIPLQPGETRSALIPGQAVGDKHFNYQITVSKDPDGEVDD